MNRTATLQDVEAFVERCQEIVDKHMQTNFPMLPREVLGIMPGKRYFRIVKKTEGQDKTGSAWAFVDSTNGDVLKPAGWKRPAKHARGNIFDMSKGLGWIGPYGPAYLR